MSSSLHAAIVKTLAYADIFDYPLTADEIYLWSIGQKYSDNKLHHYLKKTTGKSDIINKWQGFYFLPGRKNTVFSRKLKQKYSQKKKKIAGNACRIIRFIPWVKMVGITGALSVDNADDDDDIDLMIITSCKRLWLTRFLLIILTELLGLRRRPNQKNIRNKICFNLFLDDKHLSLPEQERDLYCAHEILQVVPLYTKDNSYFHFLDQNQWVGKHLPNAFFNRYHSSGESNSHNHIRSSPDRFLQILYVLARQPLDLIEFFLQKLQLLYMRKRRTTEVINDGYLRFHPHDAREWIIKKYQRRIAKNGISS